MANFKETKEMFAETTPVGLSGLAWFCIVAVVVAAVSLGIYWFVAPAKVAIDNAVFHNSQAYNDSMLRDLDEAKMQYATASQDGKDAIRATIQHRFAGYDRSKVPVDDQAFLAQMMGN